MVAEMWVLIIVTAVLAVLMVRDLARDLIERR
jgi:hypothetical protein